MAAAKSAPKTDTEPRKGTARTHLELKAQELGSLIDRLTGDITTHRQHADEAEATKAQHEAELADVNNALKVLQEND